MLLVLSALLSLASLTVLFHDARKGLLFLFLVKPIIDTAWNTSIFGLRLTPFVGTVVPLLLLLHALRCPSEERIGRVPLSGFWIAYLCINLFGCQIIALNSINEACDTFFRILNGFTAYYALQRYFRSEADYKNLLLSLLLAGIFPIGVAMYQLATGHAWTHWSSVGFSRNIGLYHDQATLKYYVFQVLASGVLYWTTFLHKKAMEWKFILFSYLIMNIVALYKLYVKSGNAVVVIWIFLWFSFRRKYKWIFVIIGSFLMLDVCFGNAITRDLFQVFHREIYAIQGDYAIERSFSGRWYGWGGWLDWWSNSGLFLKLFGTGHSGYGLHNDFLFALSRSGLVGLIAYLALLIAVGVKLIRAISRFRSALNVVALMVFCLYLVETIGLVPSGYPSFQWFVWGVVGLSLRLAELDGTKSGKGAGVARSFERPVVTKA